MLKFVLMGLGGVLLIFGPLPELFHYSNQVFGLILIIAGPATAHFVGNR